MATSNSISPEEVAIPMLPRSNQQSPKVGFQNNEFDAKPTNHFPQCSEINIYSSPESPLIRKRLFRSKSRFGEPSVPLDSQTLENFGGSPRFMHKSSFTEKTPRVGSTRFKGEAAKDKKKQKERSDEEEIYKRVTEQLSAKKSRMLSVKLVLELLTFLSILACLVCSITIESFKGKLFFGLEVWKWFALLMVIFSGMFLTGWFVQCIVFLIEWKFLLKKHVVYFTHGLQTNVVVLLWIAVVLITWVVLFKHDSGTAPKVSSKTKEKLDFITWTIASLLISSFLWVVKTTLIRILASSFHLNRFFERIQEALFHHYVLQALSGSPVVEMARKLSREESRSTQVSFTEHIGKNTTEKKVVDWRKLHHMKKEEVPSWTMMLLVEVISNSGLSTLSNIVNQDVVEGGVELDDDEITSEEEAIAAAVRIFYNVIGDKDEFYLDRSDLLRFMMWEEVDLVYQLFELNEKRQVTLKAFSQWVVKVYQDRQALKHALSDNKSAVDELSKLLNGILIIITIILWLLVTEIVTTKIILFFSSQLLVAVFVFGNTCKTTFEAIIFVFVMHPFDVGDRCIIDGTMMVVEEMKILTTVFLKLDKEKVYYPNSVLATKSIGNYYRSPDQADTLEFAIDYATPLPKISRLRERIKQYLEQTPHLWHPNHNFLVKEIENVNKLKMALFFNHTSNFQDWTERGRRKTELVLEMKNIFDDLEISYHLLPQEILLTKMGSNV